MIYLTVSCVLGFICIVVSLWERFGEPQFRPLRAGKHSISNHYFLIGEDEIMAILVKEKERNDGGMGMS